jgi:hypothetical protein
MKRAVLVFLTAVLWAGSLWIVFWLGFLESQTIASQTRHLDDLRYLSDQKVLLRSIDAGEVSKAHNELKGRIAIGDSLAQMQVSPEYSFFDAMRYAVYPREALSLIQISSSKDQEAE